MVHCGQIFELYVCMSVNFCSHVKQGKVFVTLELISTFTRGYFLSPVGLWEIPCGGADPLPGQLEHRRHFISYDLRVELQLLKTKANTASCLCSEISNRLVSVIARSVASYLDTVPTLPGFPETDTRYFRVSNIHIVRLLLLDLDRLSRVGVFLEQVISDSTEHIDELSELEVKYREIVCQITRILKLLNQDVTSDVSRDIMNRNHRSVTDYLQLHRRNYVIIRDIQAVLISVVNNIDYYIQERLH